MPTKGANTYLQKHFQPEFVNEPLRHTLKSSWQEVNHSFTCWSGCQSHHSSKSGNQIRMVFLEGDTNRAPSQCQCQCWTSTRHIKTNLSRSHFAWIFFESGEWCYVYKKEQEDQFVPGEKRAETHLGQYLQGGGPTPHPQQEATLTQRQALAMAHTLFDPVQSAPFLSSALKFMYIYLIITTSLAEEK